jgi:phosphonoacetaldehyde hydrolase
MQNVKAVIFDWAGTMIDHGSLAPMGAFVETFAEFGVSITMEEARGPMGMAKRPHVAAILNLPRVAAAWAEKYGHMPGEKNIDDVYAAFVPKNVAVAARYATLIEGAAETVEALRVEGVKIGSTTGYTREIMAEILPLAAEQGFAPESVVCAGDTVDGRPTPLMYYKALLDLAVWPTWRTVKVDDTTVGVAEGLNAGAWTVGVAVTGNLFGLSLEATRALPARDFMAKRQTATARLLEAGAHYVIDGVAELPTVLSAIEGRLARGERP